MKVIKMRVAIFITVQYPDVSLVLRDNNLISYNGENRIPDTTLVIRDDIFFPRTLGVITAARMDLTKKFLTPRMKDCLKVEASDLSKMFAHLMLCDANGLYFQSQRESHF